MSKSGHFLIKLTKSGIDCYKGNKRIQPHFEVLGSWDYPNAEPHAAHELISELNAILKGMYAVIESRTEEEWQVSWTGDEQGDPELITRQWVIWHLVEPDLHHGGEISITLGAHGVPALDL